MLLGVVERAGLYTTVLLPEQKFGDTYLVVGVGYRHQRARHIHCRIGAAAAQ
jgi:hypothetical protein